MRMSVASTLLLFLSSANCSAVRDLSWESEKLERKVLMMSRGGRPADTGSGGLHTVKGRALRYIPVKFLNSSEKSGSPEPGQ